MILPCLFMAPTAEMGRGIYTEEALEAGVLVEISPVIVMSAEERLHLDQTLLHDYIFEWGINRKDCCMALGYISVYNHSYHANCEYEMDYAQALIAVRTVKPIAAGEELFINYNGGADDETPLWFEAK